MVPRELTTARLLLRQWRDEDMDPFHEIYTHPDVLATLPARTRAETAVKIERFRRRWADDGYSHWAACDLESGRLIGRIGLLRHHDWPLGDRPVPEVGWTLHRDFWGRGLATEGGQAAIDCWREHLLDEPQLISITLSRNRRSRAVMERLGLTCRGEARWHDHDVVWYALDRAGQ